MWVRSQSTSPRGNYEKSDREMRLHCYCYGCKKLSDKVYFTVLRWTESLCIARCENCQKITEFYRSKAMKYVVNK